MIFDTFTQHVLDTIEKTAELERENILKAAKLMSDTIANDGLVYTFGTGHSYLIAKEIFYRAGGLVPIYCMMEESVAGNHEITKSSMVERLSGYAKIILDYHQPTSKDVVIIISNSGRNAVAVEMALECQLRNIKTIAITSVFYSKAQRSRHVSGKRLFEIADIVCDNHAGFGDATLEIMGLDQKVGPTSNITSGYIIHSMMVQAIENLVVNKKTAPVFYSGNLDGATEKNQELLSKYKHRIKVF